MAKFLGSSNLLEQNHEEIQIMNRSMTSNEIESVIIKKLPTSKSSSKREVYSNTVLLQETRKISNKQPNLTPKATRERRTNKKEWTYVYV